MPADEASAKQPYRFKRGTAEEAGGLGCPKCGCLDWRVSSTWGARGAIRRRRVCRHCGYEISTSETPN